jgi:hypothetical protein
MTTSCASCGNSPVAALVGAGRCPLCQACLGPFLEAAAGAVEVETVQSGDQARTARDLAREAVADFRRRRFELLRGGKR